MISYFSLCLVWQERKRRHADSLMEFSNHVSAVEAVVIVVHLSSHTKITVSFSASGFSVTMNNRLVVLHHAGPEKFYKTVTCKYASFGLP